jgi:phosphocarrier protein HPr
MLTTDIEIINRLGLHARAAAKLVSTASSYSCSVKVGFPDRLVDGKSIMAVMMLAASKGMTLQICTDGEDEQAALDDICDLINRRFDEPE